MRNYSKKILFCTVLAAFQTFSVLAAPAVQPETWKVTGRAHVTAVTTSLRGPGADVPGLPQVYDLSIFDVLLGGKHTRVNGSGVTNTGSAPNFPLVDGEALVQSTKIGVAGPVTEQLKAGVSAEIYSLLGDRMVGQVFGPELPWGNFPRENGAIETPHFWADLYNGYLEGKNGPTEFKVLGGTLPADELPKFTRSSPNQVNLGSLVWRAPVTNESYFEKSEWKYLSGRHAVRGSDLTVRREYAEKHFLSLEAFTASAEPTPISDIERDAYGFRAASDIERGNIGFTSVYNDGLKAVSGYHETQWVWAVDASYPVIESVVPFGAAAWTDYAVETPDEDHTAGAYVAGVLLKCPQKYELKLQYQYVEENYDLMTYHKKEHFPPNTQGPAIQLSGPLGPTINIKAFAYFVRQLETETSASDTIFGDTYFPSSAGSDEGTINAERIDAEWAVCPSLTFKGNVEHAKFRKNFVLAANNIDKDVYSFYGSLQIPITAQLKAEGGLRHFFSVGNWQTTPFRAYQNSPEAALVYQIDKNRHATLIYHRIEYEDNTGISEGRNDYDGHQVLFEFKTVF